MSTYQEMEELMTYLASNIDNTLTGLYGRKGFVLLVFEFGAPAIANYITNGKREDIIKALRETADRLEASEDLPPAIGGVQ